jgi:hypothetical protein
MASPAAASGVPHYDHIVIVMEENESSTNIIGSSQAPYINSLAAQGANFTDAHGEAHPSQPNYLALFSGSTQGVTDDTQRAYTGPNLATQLSGAGKTFVGYSQGLNSGSNWKGYHSPWLGWSTTTAAQKQDWTAFPSNYSNLPNAAIVVPDACNDMHDCSISTGDTWLKNNMDAYAQWAKTHNSLLLVTWDEDGGVGGTTSGNHIAAIAVGANVTPGNYSQTINHYGMLGMVEDANGLPRLNNAGSQPAVTAPFTGATTAPPTTAPPTTAPPTTAPPTTAPPSTTPPADPGDGTQAATTLGWGTSTGGDEFNYTGAPNPAKWSVYNSAGNAGKGLRVPSAWNVDGQEAVVSGDAAGNTGGMEALFAKQTYGKWEARMKTSSSTPEYHPVMILWPDAASSTCAEIDYAEGGWAGPQAMNFFLHYACSGSNFQNSSQTAVDVTQWHNYAVDWEPGTVTGYIDGVQVFNDTTTAHQPVTSMHQTLQLDWFPDSNATVPTTMSVDWVRTYAVGADNPPTNPPTSPPATTPPATTPPATTPPATTPPATTPAPEPAPSSALVVLNPMGSNHYDCTVDLGSHTNTPCDLRYGTEPPMDGPGMAHVQIDPGNAYGCTVSDEDYGWANIPCGISTIP